MASVALFVVSVFSLFTHLVADLYSAQEVRNYRRCSPSPYSCNGVLGSFPFKYKTQPPECGLYNVDCSNDSGTKIQFKEKGYWHDLERIDPLGWVSIKDEDLQDQLQKDKCSDEVFDKLSLPSYSPFIQFFSHNLTLFKCNNNTTLDKASYTEQCNNGNHTYFITSNADNGLNISPTPPQCTVIQLPLRMSRSPYNISHLTAEFRLRVLVISECYKCLDKNGKCQDYKGSFKCLKPVDHITPATSPFYGGPPPTPDSGKKLEGPEEKKKWKLWLGLGVGISGIALLIACSLFMWRRKQKIVSSNLLSRNISCQPNSKSDLEGGAYFGAPLFTYNELDTATNHFDGEKEIGDGGFGTVYHGKLKDGREVAVKRLYEHNYRRVEQFMNEIEILTRLRHKNLVSLYGCTSRRSRELLLVYEFIPNGTVADHLHGDLVDRGLLTWPIRMSIAIETANALSYLHASDIVHRDVKTTNILLDNNFCVKVADFGLSRFFPLDVTHVSTAPQGTPGYVDPEYHQCYQLTSKSDVYSFGVVLIELISSLPAVDITRHRHEINLSNIAINKIQRGLYSELVDSSLGFESNHEVKRMTIAVAELAFQCLQQDNDARPTMCEVLEALKAIESGSDVPDNLKEGIDDVEMKKTLQPPPSPECDELELLKNMRPPTSPISVTQNWPSTRSSTPNASS